MSASKDESKRNSQLRRRRGKGAEFIRWIPYILDCLRELGGSGRPREVTDWISDKLDVWNEISEHDQSWEGGAKFYNQVAWGRQYLTWEGLLDSSKRGVWALTEKGFATNLTDDQAREIVRKWVRFHSTARGGNEKKESPDKIQAAIPAEEAFEEELLETLLNVTPSGFEQICQRLLRESDFEKVTVTGKSHDGGIDGIGILQVNPFVSFKVLLQCKRYRGVVARAHVGDFRNAMLGRADKGIIITTGTFSADAKIEAQRDGAPPVELIDGERLVAMLIKLGLGVKPRTVYEIDHSFFSPFMPTKGGE
jgi:restriction system protein